MMSLVICPLSTFHILVISEYTWSIGSKLCTNDAWGYEQNI